MTAVPATTAASPWDLTAKSGGGDFETLKAGAYPAVLVALVDLGTHQEEFEEREGKRKGQKTVKDMRKVLLVWELTGEANSKGENFIIGKDFNVTFTEKAALRKFCETWRGKKFAENENFNISVLVGKSCLITTTEGTSAKGKSYAKLENVGPLPRGMVAPAPKHAPQAYPLGSSLPEWLPYIYGTKPADYVASSIEIRGKTAKPATTTTTEQSADNWEPEAPPMGQDPPF